jgi:hypothetical protein
MLDEGTLADVEGDALAMFGLAGLDPGDAVSFGELCYGITRRWPRSVALDGEARLEPIGDDGFEVLTNRAISPERQRLKGAHELGHWWYRRIGYRGFDLEARCDALGAALIAPREAFRAAMRWAGHRVHELALRFNTTQSLALLRVGEVSGRPVMLLRPSGPLARGDLFEWPKTSTLVRALNEGRSAVHPLRINDEPHRWGLMARR